jgi:hypothetical protein
MKKLLAIIVLGLMWFNTVLALPKCVGEDTSKWTKCEGTKTKDDLWTYTGEWKDGVRHGQGLTKFKNGTSYIGEWKNDDPNGYGTLIYSDKMKYVGEVKNGLPHGQGSMTVETVGQWKDGNFIK